MAKPLDTLLQEASKKIPSIEVEECFQKKDLGVFKLLDLREDQEIPSGKIAGSVHVPKSFLEMRISELVPDLNEEIVLYCAGGTRSLLAAQSLKGMGYKNVFNLEGGIQAWVAKGLPIVEENLEDIDFKERYSRHFLLPEIGYSGQKKLSQAKVLVVGAGGLGSPLLLYLCASGVGTIGIVDDDTVDKSNLQRQVAHSSYRIGMPKVKSAKRTLEELNPRAEYLTFQTRLDASNAREIIEEFDLVIDGSDNLSTRYLINDVCVEQKKPMLYGSVIRFSGQVSVMNWKSGPCYRCIFPEPPPKELMPNCSEEGVMGVLPGVIGLLQATEAIKLLLDIGEVMSGEILSYDALKMDFKKLRVAKNPRCMCNQ